MSKLKQLFCNHKHLGTSGSSESARERYITVMCLRCFKQFKVDEFYAAEAAPLNTTDITKGA